MEEPLSEDSIQEMLEELEEEDLGEESQPLNISELLRDLQWGPIDTRKAAAERLGKLEESSLEIVKALVAVKETEPIPVVRMAAEEALRAPAHQEYLQQATEEVALARRQTQRLAPDLGKAKEDRQLAKAARGAYKEAPIHSERAKEWTRKKPASSTALLLRIAVGILLVGTGVANLQSRLGCFLIPAGLALIGWFVWEWRGPRSPRNMFLRSMKEAPAEIVKVRKEEHREYDGDKEVKYYLTVLFRAVSTQGTNRDILLSLKVGSSLWRSAASGQIWTIRYSAEDPTIALIQGEW